MTPKFSQRFHIEIGEEEARRRFVNHLHGFVFQRFVNDIPGGERYRIRDDVIIGIGKTPKHGLGLAKQIGDDFHTNLYAVEALYKALHFSENKYGSLQPSYDHASDYYRERLSADVNDILQQSEIDLSLSWRNGQFSNAGAALLDDQLVNQPLQ